MALNPPVTCWQGQRVWLVGASSGIGRATAAALHAQGAHVLVSARDAGALQDFVQNHPGSQTWPMDVTDVQAVRRTVDAIWAQGPVDRVVFCAAHYRASRAQGGNLDDWLRHNQVNYVGALHLLHAVLPHLLAQPLARRGHISLMASVAGYRGLPNSLAYGPTKAALINLAESMYTELRPLGVGVSVVNPGFVQTPLTAQNRFAMPALISSEAAAKAMLAGWAQGAFEIHFPRRFTLGMKLLRWLPDTAFFALTGRLGT